MNELGDYIPPEQQYCWRDHNLYKTLNDANTKKVDTELSLHNAQEELYMIRHIPWIVSNLPKPDLLYPMQLRMLDHLQKWIFHFMEMHQRLDKYNAIWLSLPAFHNFTPKNTSYEVIPNGTERRWRIGLGTHLQL